MTVLGKIPAVPKPINLPSQRFVVHSVCCFVVYSLHVACGEVICGVYMKKNCHNMMHSLWCYRLENRGLDPNVEIVPR
jgi:hypothetical protein